MVVEEIIPKELRNNQYKNQKVKLIVNQYSCLPGNNCNYKINDCDVPTFYLERRSDSLHVIDDIL